VPIRSFLRHPIALGLATLAVGLTPALLLAHAKLVRSDPSADAVLTAQPSRISLWFSERPEPKFTVVQLLDSAGAAIVLGQPVLDAKAMEISLDVPPNLRSGKYTVSWRTAAADGHASNGKFAFTLNLPAKAEPAVPPPVASPADTPIIHVVRPRANAIVTQNETSAVSSALRWAELVSLLTIIGAIIVRLIVIPRAGWSADLVADAGDRARSLAQSASVLLLCTTLYRAATQSQMMTGAPTSFFGRLSSLVRETNWGQGWAIGAAGVLAIVVGLFVARRGVGGWTLAALGAVFVAGGQALTGHAASNAHPALAVATDVVHVLGAGGWLGGLVAVILSALPVTRRLSAGESARAGSALVRSYHSSALECVVLVVISAAVATWLRLPALSDLWTTPYGNMLLRKLFFVVVVLLFGLYHWRRVVNVEWTDDTRGRFRRSAILELLAGAVVVAFTALLISTALPT
jgi:copper transport protein